MIARKINKLALRGGGDFFSKIPELMHNVLSNQEYGIDGRHTYHFRYIFRFL